MLITNLEIFLGVIYDELALIALTKCIELEPTNPDAYFDRAFCYRDLNHYNQAISDLNKAIELSPNNGKFYKFRGIFLEEDENFSEAVKDFSKLIELNFENVAEWYAKRGENFFELREFEKALADYEKAVELNYKHKDSAEKRCTDIKKILQLNELKFGSWYFTEKKLKGQAILMENEIFEEKLKLAQENFDAGNFNNAVAYCKQALSYSPENFQAVLLLGKAYFAKWDDEAFKCFELAKKLRPNSAEGYFHKGKAILYRGNNYKKAMADFDKAIELDASNAETYFLRGDAQARLKNFSQAIEDFTKAAEMKPEEKIYKKRGEVYLKIFENEKAIADFNKVLEFSADESAYKGLAIAYANLKNKKLALENFDKFLELSGEENFYDLLGEIYFALGDFEKAIENCNKHLEIKSYAVEIYYLRGRSYFEQKNFASALADFEKYVSTWYEIMSDGCYLSESETNYAEAKNFCDLCRKNLGINLDKKIIKSMLFGFAVADALGVPVEFKSRESLKKNPVTLMQSYGTYNQPAGTWSDDTSMTLATMESISRLKKIDYADIMENFSFWLETGAFTPFGKVFDCGITTRRAVFNFSTKIFGKTIPPLECGLRDENSNGNGSLMRILPVVCYLYKIYGENFSSDAMQIIHEISCLTHAHKRSQIGCGIYSLIAVELLSGKNISESVELGLDKAKNFYANEPELNHYSRLFQADFKNLPEEEIKSSGYVVHTLEAALWCLLNTENYKSLALKAVNLGEDTDTVAAVAGGLAGIFYGLENIPTDWLETLQNKKYLENIAENFCTIF